MADAVAEAMAAAGAEAVAAGGALAADPAGVSGAVGSAGAAAAAAATGVPMPGALRWAGGVVSGWLCSGAVPVLVPHVDECDAVLGAAVVAIFLAPFLWNCLGRLEFYTGVLSAVFVRPRVGAAVLAAWIFSFSLYRDALFFAAVARQPRLDALDTPLWHAAAGACGVVGAVLVATSFWRLGFYGTYLGDYFGILMDEKVEGFPFSFTEHPMYDGSTLLFLAKAILEKSPAGIALTVWVFIMYRMACIFEGPFTSMIYATRDRRTKANAHSKSH